MRNVCSSWGSIFFSVMCKLSMGSNAIFRYFQKSIQFFIQHKKILRRIKIESIFRYLWQGLCFDHLLRMSQFVLNRRVVDYHAINNSSKQDFGDFKKSWTFLSYCVQIYLCKYIQSEFRENTKRGEYLLLISIVYKLCALGICISIRCLYIVYFASFFHEINPIKEPKIWKFGFWKNPIKIHIPSWFIILTSH